MKLRYFKTSVSFVLLFRNKGTEGSSLRLSHITFPKIIIEFTLTAWNKSFGVVEIGNADLM